LIIENQQTNCSSISYTSLNENIFSLPIFTKEEANLLIEEIKHFKSSKLPKLVPNPFAKNLDDESCVLNEFLLDEIKPFVKFLINFIVKIFPHYGILSDSDFLAFCSRYENNNQSSIHVDESHVTVSIPLNEEFEGGELVFEKKTKFIVEQRPFHAIIFPGHFPHYTLPTRGLRYNLVIYLKQTSNNNFYDQEYTNYLSLMGIPKWKHEDYMYESNVIFQVPSLPKLKEIKCKKNLTNTSNQSSLMRISFWNLSIIFSFLNNNELLKLEYTCKYFKEITQFSWQDKYDKINKDITESTIKVQNNYRNTFDQISTNYKNLYQSNERSRNYNNSEDKQVITLHLNDSIGESYLKYVSETLNIKNHSLTLESTSSPLEILFDNPYPGVYQPRSIFILDSSPSDYLKNNVYFENLFMTNSSLYGRTINDAYTINLESFYERLRKINESLSHSSSELIISCDSSGFNVGVLSRIREHLLSDYYKKEIIICPLIKDYDINSALLVSEMCKEYPLMQYELPAITRTIQQLSSEHNFTIRPENMMARAINGVTFNNLKISELVPYPTISVITQSFSPFVSSNSSLGEVTYQAIIKQALSFRETDFAHTCAMLLSFYGDIVPKDIMAVVGSIKTKRNIEFVDWMPTGFKCHLNYHKELALYDTKKDTLRQSVHCFGNTKDTQLLYSKLNLIEKKDWKAEFIEYEEVKDNLQAKIQDYIELYAPREEVENDVEN
jgi:hypothetical protein